MPLMDIRTAKKPWSGYERLASTEKDVQVEEQQLRDGIHDAERRPSTTILCITLANVALFVLTAAMFVSTYRSQERRSTELNAKLRATSSYSPIFDMIDLEPSIKKINGSILPPHLQSIARQLPNPTADAIWEEDIELIRPIPITREQVIQLGKDPDTVAKFDNDVWGLGDDAYVAALDVFHDLHCLNTLRQAAYSNYYNLTTANATAKDSLYEIHLNHCIDILYQHISCSNNVNLVTRHWREGLTYPSPDFSINKECINFEKLTAWHKEVSVDMKKWRRVMKKPEGAKEEPTEKFGTQAGHA